MFMTKGIKAFFLRQAVSIFYKVTLRGKRKLAIFQNPDDRETFFSLNLVKPEQANLIRSSGVDIKRFVPSETPKGVPEILLCSRMLWDKGIGELIAAARLLREWGVPGKVILAGGSDAGNPTAIPDSQLEKWQTEGIVSWIGHQEDVQKVYSTASIAVLPSYREGVPKSLIEAAACGLPLVATDVPGCREIVRHGENGFLVPVRDSKALANALKILIENPELRARMGARGREIAVKEFSSDRVIAETQSVYREVLNQAGLEKIL